MTAIWFWSERYLGMVKPWCLNIEMVPGGALLFVAAVFLRMLLILRPTGHPEETREDQLPNFRSPSRIWQWKRELTGTIYWWLRILFEIGLQGLLVLTPQTVVACVVEV